MYNALGASRKNFLCFFFSSKAGTPESDCFIERHFTSEVVVKRLFGNGSETDGQRDVCLCNYCVSGTTNLNDESVGS